MTSRADLHCHSTSATPPETLYALAKWRGMDFVTITDHDSIDGVLSIADHEDVFMSVELAASCGSLPPSSRSCLPWSWAARLPGRGTAARPRAGPSSRARSRASTRALTASTPAGFRASGG